MVMQNWSLETILVVKYDTLGFTMEAEATLDVYGRWKSNQSCNTAISIYIYSSTPSRNLALLHTTGPI